MLRVADPIADMTTGRTASTWKTRWCTDMVEPVTVLTALNDVHALVDVESADCGCNKIVIYITMRGSLEFGTKRARRR